MIQLNNFLKTFILFFLFTSSAYALNTSNARGSTTVYALSPQEVYNISNDVWGFVTYQDGFDITTTVTLGLGLASPIKGGEIKIADGGTLELLTDLEIGSTVKFTIGSSSGDTAYIIGNDGSLICDGGFTVPDNRNIKLAESGLVIDCKGNYLDIGENSHIIFDPDSTLTIRNAIITGLQGTANSDGAITLNNNSSMLTFQNVVIDLEDDYDMNLGWLFIYDDVVICGDGFTFKRSSIVDDPNQKPTIVTEFSKLTFDRGVTFEYDYRSSVSTRCREQFILKDLSSILELDNCVLSVPTASSSYAGLFLRDGSLILDNLVTLSNYDGVFVNQDPQKGIIFGNIQDTSAAVNLNLKVLSDCRTEILGSLSVTKANFV